MSTRVKISLNTLFIFAFFTAMISFFLSSTAQEANQIHQIKKRCLTKQKDEPINLSNKAHFWYNYAKLKAAL